MMKKAIKKLLAALLAVAMVCAMAIPAFAYNPGDTEKRTSTTTTVTPLSRSSRVLLVRTIRRFPTLTWGSHITNPDNFLDELKETPIIGAQFRSIDATDATDLPLFRKFLRLSANGTIPMLTASLSRVLYATISTRMVEPRNPTL